ncbi:hypothetical protein [Asticcacaulis sp. YBE204]|uniref:hypothetical protein n=1 Tax=Asticcacaulis sp. YBE204 TaxID=1282363 RepID=UPI0003C3B24B|nr:hypothetical protein [Asticcacaulis sp. YBE204]ESQ76481.1 hypothetical protein AEYBE204_19465 [Asticcacaulis sp. YBE204]
MKRIFGAMILVLALVSGDVFAAPDGDSLTFEGLKTRPTAEIAAHLLTADEAAEIAAHKTLPGVVANAPPSSVQLFARAEPAIEGICRRTVYHVDLLHPKASDPDWADPKRVVRVDRVRKSGQIALGKACGNSLRFAWVQPSGNQEEAMRVLVWLDEMRAETKIGKRPKITVTCVTDTTMTCTDNAWTFLAHLPLENTFIIERSSENLWVICVPLTEPGGLYWEIRVSVDTEGLSSLALRQRIPAPF